MALLVAADLNEVAGLEGFRSREMGSLCRIGIRTVLNERIRARNQGPSSLALSAAKTSRNIASVRRPVLVL